MINIELEERIIQYVKNMKRGIKWNNIPKEFNDYLSQRYSDNITKNVKESFLRIINNIETVPLCPVCGKRVKYRGLLNQPYAICCETKNCQNHIRKVNSNKTKIERYGNANYANTEKARQTKIERYGDPNYVNKEKTRQTKIERYGDPNYVNKEKIVQTCLERYGVKNGGCSKQALDKIKNTFLEKYGVDVIWKAKEVIEKSKQSKLERYGDPNYVNIEKARQTKLEKYGDPNYANREKAKQTCLERYGVEHNWQIESEHLLTHTKEANEKKKQTSLKHYGVDNPLKSKIVREKITVTKRKNHSFNTSQIETDSYRLLKEKYDDVIYQYKSEKYPFCCDFYVPTLDLYIECNYHWTHGEHPYNENDEADKKKVTLWRMKNSNYYKNAIKCWTIRDVKKRNVAKQNCLNYIEFWNLSELKKWLSNI